jgi:hypothetical protein
MVERIQNPRSENKDWRTKVGVYRHSIPELEVQPNQRKCPSVCFKCKYASKCKLLNHQYLTKRSWNRTQIPHQTQQESYPKYSSTRVFESFPTFDQPFRRAIRRSALDTMSPPSIDEWKL